MTPTCVALSRSGAGPALVCFPYAGAGASAFREWPRLLPARTLWGIRLPGRESRLNESLPKSLPEVASTVAAELKATIETPYVFYGHSLGALLAFLVALELDDDRAPAALVLAACRAPHVAPTGPRLEDVPGEQFLRRLVELNGMPNELLANRELLELFLPIIHRDFILAETYVHPRVERLEMPLHAFVGRGDPLPVEAAAAWERHAAAGFALRQFEGDHFFMHSDACNVTAAVDRLLAHA